MRRANVVNHTIHYTKDGPKRTMAADIPIALHDAFQTIAEGRGMTKNGLMRQVITRIAERPDLLVAILPEARQ